MDGESLLALTPQATLQGKVAPVAEQKGVTERSGVMAGDMHGLPPSRALSLSLSLCLALSLSLSLARSLALSSSLTGA